MDKLQPIYDLKKVTDSVIVSFSLGKDSVVCLDLCCQHFKTVKAFFGYFVKGLSFQEKVLQWYENKYNIEILRIPHWNLARYFKLGCYCQEEPNYPTIHRDEVFNYARKKLGLEYVSIGYRKSDGTHRYMAIATNGHVNHKTKKFYPVAYFKRKEIDFYIKNRKLLLPFEYQHKDHGITELNPYEFYLIKKYHPDDYRKVLKVFPQADMGVIRYIDYIKPKREQQEKEKKLKRKLAAEKRKQAKEKEKNAKSKNKQEEESKN